MASAALPRWSCTDFVRWFIAARSANVVGKRSSACKIERQMRRLTFTVLLTCLSSALAQTQSTQPPDPAACARLVAPHTRPMSPALTAAVQTTLGAYKIQGEGVQRLLTTRPPTATERRQLEALQLEATTYFRRLLRTQGWPSDPRIRASLALFLSEPEVQWCAGQVALKDATTLAERQQAAQLIDRSLLNLGGKQRYGTVTMIRARKVQPFPLEDEASVDALRASIGLPPLAEQLARQQAELPPRPAPTGLKRPVMLREVCQSFTNQTALNTPLTTAQIDVLAQEAGRLVEQDQASRMGKAGARGMAEVDAESTAWLKTMLGRFGWPSTNRSDPDLASNAWLLTQHADRTPSLQACVLDLIGQQQSTQREAQDLAYLTDRVRLGQGQPQVYGTQVSYNDVQGKASPMMLEDPERVNERRAKIGLETIEEYLKRFERPRP